MRSNLLGSFVWKTRRANLRATLAREEITGKRISIVGSSRFHNSAARRGFQQCGCSPARPRTRQGLPRPARPPMDRTPRLDLVSGAPGDGSRRSQWIVLLAMRIRHIVCCIHIGMTCHRRPSSQKYTRQNVSRTHRGPSQRCQNDYLVMAPRVTCICLWAFRGFVQLA